MTQFRSENLIWKTEKISAGLQSLMMITKLKNCLKLIQITWNRISQTYSKCLIWALTGIWKHWKIWIALMFSCFRIEQKYKGPCFALWFQFQVKKNWLFTTIWSETGSLENEMNHSKNLLASEEGDSVYIWLDWKSIMLHKIIHWIKTNTFPSWNE